MFDGSAANAHVFISYVRNNKLLVQRLSDELTKQGVKVWLDRNKIMVGFRWRDAVEEAIKEGAFFIACFSKQYSERDEAYANEELTLAIDMVRKLSPDRIWFIPVKLNRCEIPKRRISDVEKLTDFHWVELYKNWNVGIKSILDVINPISPRIHDLIESLGSENDELRVSATRELSIAPHHGAINALIYALDDENWQVRSSVAEAFGKIGESSVPDLLKALKDKREIVRESAAKALGEVRIPAVIPDLVGRLSDESEGYVVYGTTNPCPACAAAHALGKIGGPAVPALLEVLSDEREIVRGYAALALGKIGRASIPGLLGALKDEREKVRTAAARALRDIEASQASYFLIDAIPALLAALSDESAEVRGYIASTLGNIGEPTASMPALLEALNDEDEIVRACSASALGDIGQTTAIPALLRALRDENVLVRRNAAYALGNIGEPETISALMPLLNGEHQTVCESAIRALGKIGGPAVPALLEALSDEKEKVRESAAEALGEIADSVSIPALTKALHDEDSDVRGSAAYALANIAHPGSVPALIEALHDEDSDVRHSATYALENIGTPEALEAVEGHKKGKRR